MKKLLFILSMGCLLFSCEKHPDFEKLDSRLVVYSQHAKEADFSTYQTYFLPDSILDVRGRETVYWKDKDAQLLINEVEEQMNSRGYKRLTDASQKDKADLGIQLTYLAQTNLIAGGYWGGWWDYGYWGPWWNGWYYPYSIAYAYETNTLIMEILELHPQKTAEESKKPNKLPVLWYTYSTGYKYNKLYNTDYLLESIDKAFEQSPYINSGK